MRELPKYKKETGEENDESGGQEDDGEKKPLSDEFSEKTNQLLDYIEKTYLQGVIEDDPQGKNIIEKMRLDNTQKVGYIVYKETSLKTLNKFIFGQTPTHSHVKIKIFFNNRKEKMCFCFRGVGRHPSTQT